MTETVALDVRHCTDTTELFRQYAGELEPQPAYIELDLRNCILHADWDGEIGNAAPATVHHGIDRRYSIPLLTAEAANRILDEIAPLARRIVADSEIDWDGNNHVAVLGPDARAAEDEIEQRLGCTYPHEHPFSDADIVGVWDIDGAVNGCEVEEYGITADTTDERLDEIEAEILSNLADCGDHTVVVCPALGTYLREQRDELRQADDEA
ncbi:hypothetical protein [Streptomyces sp. DH20]|uniref:hypothetical protein n=1 Tax=Streptomyces sp. DH20 TaxID=2857009 RepID=UPI001E45E757|nr:hypothetical protein [Streptomyces sp. DH20]